MGWQALGHSFLTYLTYLVIIAKEVKIVKEVISCDVSPVAMFSSQGALPA